jgi:hypothetical protein
MMKVCIKALGSLVVPVAMAAVLASCGGDSGIRSTSPLAIKVLSNRADLVSGGDAYVEIAGASAEGVHVDVDGRDVSSAFAKRADGRVTGVLTGLRDGKNTVTARAANARAKLVITNYPIGGPIFAGPQVQPWVCATPTAQPATATSAATNASGLSSAAIDAQCNVAAGYKLFYRTTAECSQAPRSTSPCFKPYDPNAAAPTDLAETTTDQGVTAKYIVRVERGSIDRGLYDVAVLFDPAKPWSAVAPQATWNHKLVWSFGGGSGSPYKQFAPNSTWAIDYALSRGFLVGVGAHFDHQLNANQAVAGEALMMTKEHVIDAYGDVRYTIGTGCSGGSIMQLQIASMYPGLLDGIQPSCTYPDSATTSMEVTDCVLLGNYYKTPQFAALTAGMSAEQVAAKKAAIEGHKDEKACPAWISSFGSTNDPGVFANPRNGQKMNNCFLLDSQVYDAKTNPSGVRCSVSEYTMAIWGAAPGTKVSRRAADNAGIQYGLQALQEGKLTAEEFVTLNEKIGGSDADSNFTADRMIADRQALDTAYSAGIVADPRQWAKVPIIDLRGNDNSSIHMNWRAFAVRDRLDRVNGNHDNQVIWRFGPGLLPPSQLTLDSFLAMDQWVAAIKADTSSQPLQQKIVQNKPADVFDFCYIGSDYKTKVTDWNACNADPVLRYYASPRQVAGGPLAENVLKCSLQPLKRGDYQATFTDEQWSRLKKTFATGVCDWSKPGVGMQASTPWKSFAKGPGGR